MKSIIKSIKTFNWRLWLVLALTLFIPAIYTTTRIHFLGNLPGDYGVNIASQLSRINLLYEIIHEAFILPLFYIFGNSLNSKNELENKTRTGLIVSTATYLLLSVLIIIFARPLCEVMATDKSTLEETVNYIRLESIAITIGVISKFINVLFVTINKDKYMYIMLSIQTIVTIILDVFFVSELPVSLKLGVNGIALTNIIVSSILVVLSFFLLKKEGINIFSSNKLSFSWMKEYGKIGVYSGLESFVRNIAFMIMISRLVNVISEQGNYWVANNFIWTRLLLPATALYDVIKKETAESIENIRNKTLGYIIVSTIFCIAWFASIPLWRLFLHYVLNVSDIDTVIYIVLIQSAFYVFYIFNCIFDGTIYGRGKTKYMLVQSLFTNGIYYTLMFTLYKTGVWTPTLTTISLMFGIGMAIDLLPTIGCYFQVLKVSVKKSAS